MRIIGILGGRGGVGDRVSWRRDGRVDGGSGWGRRLDWRVVGVRMSREIYDHGSNGIDDGLVERFCHLWFGGRVGWVRWGVGRLVCWFWS
jgi:hypothetical protein